MTFPISRRSLLLIVLAVVVIWFGNLEYRKLVQTDEGRYAEIPREMVASGDWVTPRLNDFKYFEKPPLQYWATAIAYEVFGEQQWTSRLWTALTGFAGILLTWFAGVRLFGREAGAYAALICASSTLYVLMGHINTLDMGVTFFITLGIFSLLIAQKEEQPTMRRNWMWLAWAAMALAVLSKGLMGLILPGAALFLYSVFNRDLLIWKRMHWISGILVFLLVAAPWFVLVMQANPEFFDFFFIHEHLQRFTSKVHGRYQPWHYFIPILLLGLLPWTLLMFTAVAKAWQSGTAKLFSPQRFLLVWVVFIYLFFTASGSKLASYLLPMVPPLALLIGFHLTTISTRRIFWLVLPVLFIVMLFLGLLSFTDRLASNALEQEMFGRYSVWLVAAMLLWLLGIVVALWRLWRDDKPRGLIVLAIASLIAAQVGITGYNELARNRSAYQMAEVIKPYVKPEVPFYAIYMYEQTLPFYIKHTLLLVNYQDEMAFGIRQEPQRWIPDMAGFVSAWKQQKEALAIIPLARFPELQDQGLSVQEIYRDELYVVVRKI
jgi:4-amino-4-deoxy-L-arabinose transferase-like glycosyltransferase